MTIDRGRSRDQEKVSLTFWRQVVFFMHIALYFIYAFTVHFSSEKETCAGSGIPSLGFHGSES